MSEKPCLSVTCSMLDRETQVEKEFMAYPITRVVLCGPMSPANPRGEPSRTFVATETGWRELGSV